MKRIISYFCIIGLLAVTLSSCVYSHNGMPGFRKEWSRLKDQVLDVVMYSARNGEGDRAKVYDILKNAFTEEDFDAEFKRLNALFKGADGEYGLSVESFTSSEKDGVTVEEGVFGLYTEGGNYIVRASRRTDTEGLISFSLAPDTENLLPERE